MSCSLSDDENTLIVTGTSGLVNVYKAIEGDKNCCANCAFNDSDCPSVDDTGSAHCGDYSRADNREIYWMKQDTPKVQIKQEPKVQAKAKAEAKESVDYEPTPHKHKDSIEKYIKDINQKVYFWNDYIKDWIEVNYQEPILWYTDRIYAVGAKPTEPPAKLLKFPWGTIEFYAPKDTDMQVEQDYNTFSAMHYVGADHEFKFDTEEHLDLFRRAYLEYQNNLFKFLEGKLV
jgi:hypothetical protein